MLTVLLAVRSAGATLPATVAALGELRAPPGGWRVVVVDNGSEDGTAALLDEAMVSLPLVRVSEPVPGKNRALNRGLREVRGDLVVLTDGDVLPRPGWLEALRSAADGQPGFDIFGGPVLPRWPARPPAWLRPLPLDPLFSVRPPLPAGPVDPRRVFGPNMAIRTRVFDDGVRFDEAIGPNGGRYAMGSETELLLRLARRGHRAWHCPDAVVEHVVRHEQLTREWVQRRAVLYGRGAYRLRSYRIDPPPLSAAGRVRRAIRELLTAAPGSVRQAWSARRLDDPDAATLVRWDAAFRRGRAREALADLGRVLRGGGHRGGGQDREAPGP